MNKIIHNRRVLSFLLGILMVIGTISFNPRLAETVEAATPVTVTYRTHVQSYGWQKFVSNGSISGTTGQSKRLEGIEIRVSGDSSLGIRYTTHVQTYGWLPWAANGEFSGTSGESKRMEALMIQLTGSSASKYDIYYRVHAQGYGWLGWAKNGEMAGTAGFSKRLEAIQIVIVKKGAARPGSIAGVTSVTTASKKVGNGATANPVVSGATTTNVSYSTHIQSIGWQGWRYNGSVSGTSGQSKRVEAIKIKLTNPQYSGGITYRTYVQGNGWMDWKSNGEVSGTSGESKCVEGIQIKLTGTMATKYDVYYRTHVQGLGWLAWAKNGETSGTDVTAKRVESVQIILVTKGSSVSKTVQGVTSNKSNRYYSANTLFKNAYRETIKDLLYPEMSLYYYTLYDMNHDSIPELIIKRGNASADEKVYFYTCKDGVVKNVGNAPGSWVQFNYDKDRGEYCSLWGHMGDYCVQWYTFDGNNVSLRRRELEHNYQKYDYEKFGNFVRLPEESYSRSWYNSQWETRRDGKTVSGIETSIIDEY